MKIGITGSLSSGKSTVAKMLSKGLGPIFNADIEVKKLYSSKLFQKKVSKKFNIKGKNFKKIIKSKIINKQLSLKKLGKFVHPLVRKNMHRFAIKNSKKKYLFFEIPLLVESKLMKYFDVIILVSAPKSKRVARFVKKGGNISLFNILNKHQLKPKEKRKHSDILIVNNRSKKNLKIKVNNVKNKIL